MKQKMLEKLAALLLILALFAPVAAMGEDEIDGNAASAALEEAAVEVGMLSLGEDGISAEAANSADQGIAVATDAAANSGEGAPSSRAWDITLTNYDTQAVSVNTIDAVRVYVNIEGVTVKKWSSSKTAVAKVTERSGYADVELKKEGTVKITAKLSNNKKAVVSLTITDPNKPTSVGFARDGAALNTLTVRVGDSVELSSLLDIQPSYIDNPALTWKSSSKAKAAVDADGTLTAKKVGKAKINVTTRQKPVKKAVLNVIVEGNSVTGLSSTPTDSDISELNGLWTLWPLSMEVANGQLNCQFYFLNGSNEKLSYIDNPNLTVSAGDEDRVIATAKVGKLNVNCAAKKAKTVKVKLPITGDMSDIFLPDCARANTISLKVNSDARAKTSKGVSYAYRDMTTYYRALLIGEVNFYKICNRNRIDVGLMTDMLNSINGPMGNQYEITQQYDLSKSAVLSAISTTFADADENDVSLFFIATHGDIKNSGSTAGALMMLNPESSSHYLKMSELADALASVPGKVIVIIESCGSGAGVYISDAEQNGGAIAKSGDDELAALSAFDEAVIEAFSQADPGIEVSTQVDILSGSSAIAKTGELRVENKFYVLTASRYQEESYGTEVKGNFFTRWLTQGVGTSGDMPADVSPADGVVTLSELFNYISSVGDNYKMYLSGATEPYYQHVQVYPRNSSYELFRR